jgi:PadR family transcriptional regulator, regulatory protein PadR
MMTKSKDKQAPIDLLQGTLDLLILRTLLFGPRHGQAISKSIEQTSQDVLRVDHGALLSPDRCRAQTTGSRNQ